VSVWLIVVIAVMTYGSRALALVAMPDLPERSRAILDRVPAPLFAALAAMSLFGDGNLVEARTLVATAGAVLVSPTRSLLLVLIGGLAGYVVGTIFW
jgi:branched-subunit amino acid transport protein